MRKLLMALGLSIALITGSTVPLTAQVRTIDPNRGIDSDLATGQPQQQQQQPPPPPPSPPSTAREDGSIDPAASDLPQNNGAAPPPAGTPRSASVAAAESTYKRNDLITAGEGVFGKGAEGLAGIIEKVLKDQGDPNAYIAGREASGAFVVGARYGSGLLSHKVEGDRPVYWTGPSVGFDVGGNASKVFVLVYNLYDSEDIFRRYPEGEGHLYFVGGFSATYLRRGNIVLIPIRLGVGLRAGVNVGYMKFSKKAKWIPF